MNEVESKALLAAAGIPVSEAWLARSASEAVAMARECGFPVALKVMSRDVVHKSDAGGVRLGLQDAGQVEQAFVAMTAEIAAVHPAAEIDGVSVQRMALPGVEVIVGMNHDPQFGPVIMFGLGGVLVELLDDVAFRVVPVARVDAHEMIHEIRGLPLLQGYRGSEACDLAALEDLIVCVSRFVEANAQVREIDLNPVFARRDGVEAVDARVVVDD